MKWDKVYELRKKLAKKQELTNSDFRELEPEEIHALCRLLRNDVEVAYKMAKVRRVTNEY